MILKLWKWRFIFERVPEDFTILHAAGEKFRKEHEERGGTSKAPVDMVDVLFGEGTGAIIRGKSDAQRAREKAIKQDNITLSEFASK